MRLALVLLALGCSVVARADQTVCQDGSCDHTSIADAIEAAADGESIFVEAGPAAYADALVFSGRSLTLVGVGRPRIDVESEPAVSVEGGASLTVSGFEIAAPDERCVDADASTVLLEDVRFVSCDGALRGAAVSAVDTDLEIVDCVFEGGAAVPAEGGHLWQEGGTLRIEGSEFTDGTAGKGGAICLSSVVDAHLVDTRFTDNLADTDGGALYATATSLTVSGGSFSGGEAGDEGGALFFGSSSTVEIDGTEFAATPAAEMAAQGGFIRHRGSTLTLRGSSFSGGWAGEGGCVHLETGSQLSVEESSFSACQADSGGAIRATFDAEVTVVGSTFTDNAALGGDGGAIGSTGGAVTIQSSVFTGGSASGDGGFVFADVPDPVVIEGSDFSGGVADNGGALCLLDVPSVTLADATFSSNAAAADGGSLYATGGVVDYARVTLSDGSAGDEGGALFFGASATVVVDGSVFSAAPGDEMAAQGGFIRHRGSTLTLRGSSFEGGWAGEGGCVHLETGSELFVEGSTFSGCQADDGGAIRATFDAEVTVDGSTFSENAALVGNGGAIGSTGGGVTIRDTVFDGGSAGADGGFLFADITAPVIIERSSFMAGVAGLAGGALRVDGAPTDVVDSTFDGNAAVSAGGGLSWTGDNGDALTIAGAHFSGNQADADGDDSGSGGAVSASINGSVYVSDSVFEENSAATAGALRLGGLDDYEVLRTTFCSNHSSLGAGAVGIDNFESGTHRFAAVAFVENTAALEGGAISVSDSELELHNATIVGTISGDGAVSVDDTAEVDLRNTLIGWSAGGGVSSSGDLTLAYDAWWLNDADTIGVASLGLGAVEAEPRLAGLVLDGLCGDAVYLLGDSPLVDAGDPTILDAAPDGSRSDIGAYGGPDADLTSLRDGDGDGYAPIEGDCDDEDASINPGAVEVVGDGVDQDCSGGELCWEDLDGDGYGDGVVASENLSCGEPGEASVGGDCDDGDAGIRPDASEIPADGRDEDCDGLELCYRDLDGDGWGTEDTVESADASCSGPGLSAADTDCDDADPAIRPGVEEGVADGVDQDCDGRELCWTDADGDGYGSDEVLVSEDLDCGDAGEASVEGDCDDADPARSPAAEEGVADGIDQDCNGLETCWRDADLDGYGDPIETIELVDPTCTSAGGSPVATDCDDADESVNPAAEELPGDEIDGDCDGEELCYLDLDLDGYGIASEIVSPRIACDGPGESVRSDDCNDTRADINPGADEEPADGIDQDCDGLDACYVDVDRDGWGSDATIPGPIGCDAVGVAEVTGDCADADPARFPGAEEGIADGVDQDCDGGELCWGDVDRDGFGGDSVVDSPDLRCDSAGESESVSDCDDDDAAAFPGAPEVADDGVDQDCDGFDTVTCYVDLDGDGFGTDPVLAPDGACDDPGEADAAGDCADDDPSRFPGALEIREDGIDQDCNGSDLIGCYLDADVDGFGTLEVIDAPDGDCDDPGESEIAGDCDDAAADVYPGAPEICGDGIDQDCDGRGGREDDDDDDGLDYLTEVSLGTDACNADTDADSITDGREFELLMDPLSEDSDADGATDGFEIDDPDRPLDTDGDGTIDALDPDDDDDGVLTQLEDPGRDGDPSNDDSDADGLPDMRDLDDDGDGFDTPDEDRDGDGDPTDDDTDGDRIPDYLDPDDDGDGITTSDEVSVGADPLLEDSDGDGVLDGDEWGDDGRDTDGRDGPDIIDDDDDGDGIPTFREGGVLDDADGDGTPNYRDLDSDGDGKPDAVEGTGDIDRDTVPNFLDPDDDDGITGDPDGDGLLTGEEVELGLLPADPDSDGDGVPDGEELGSPAVPADTDGDGLIDPLDEDDDGDGLPSLEETGLVCSGVIEVRYDLLSLGLLWSCDAEPLPEPVWQDTDGDGVVDRLDLDDDGDGKPTSVEDVNGNGDWLDDDSDGDGIPDWLDSRDADGPLGDADGDGLSNSDEETLGSDPYNRDSDRDGIPDGEESAGDTDGDGLPDVIDDDDDGDGLLTSDEGNTDIDGDGIPNYLDQDSDGDGIIDSIEGLGDSDCDGVPDAFDSLDDLGCDSREPNPKVIVYEGCSGCQADSSGGAPWLGLLAALALLRRRRS